MVVYIFNFVMRRKERLGDVQILRNRLPPFNRREGNVEKTGDDEREKEEFSEGETRKEDGGVTNRTKIINPENLEGLLTLFYLHTSSIEEIDAAGESAMCIVYGGLPTDDIDFLRYTIFKKNVSNASVAKSIKPEELPPTKGSVKCHSRRVYLQIMGKGRKAHKKSATTRKEMKEKEEKKNKQEHQDLIAI
ncbi:hypothetical protein DAPPUDRAFT_109417 [Daphnia pulex]|uniref:Uncharacterized protein n=1 Tax=Daphnia pulex TaxID=6669 RepID=E9H308_DAPPU|nr:hypothetical protein DAPPUDRAFT_109417 [Daphnia pulex]|eukprot:EFX73920.1 hypothetical protein DAPPUDRAFT_109417 [Daphnia pulex]